MQLFGLCNIVNDIRPQDFAIHFQVPSTHIVSFCDSMLVSRRAEEELGR